MGDGEKAKGRDRVSSGHRYTRPHTRTCVHGRTCPHERSHRDRARVRGARRDRTCSEGGGPGWVSCREPEAVSRVSAWLRARPCGRPVRETGSWKLTPRASCCPAWRTKSGIRPVPGWAGKPDSRVHQSPPLHLSASACTFPPLGAQVPRCRVAEGGWMEPTVNLDLTDPR